MTELRDRRAYFAEYYERNKQKLKASSADYYEHNKVAVLARQSEYHQQYFNTESGKTNRIARFYRAALKYPEKYKARYALRNAVHSGIIKKQPCEICGALKVEAHHDDYSKPLEVRWLCRRHHCELEGRWIPRT